MQTKPAKNKYNPKYKDQIKVYYMLNYSKKNYIEKRSWKPKKVL